jgi:phosphotransferase system HPr (HPr) family protein
VDHPWGSGGVRRRPVEGPGATALESGSCADTMCNPKATRTVHVTNPEGIHARAATLIAELVRGSGSRVLVIKDREQANGTEVLQILSLGTAQGEEISFEATGCDAEEVLDALAQLFADNFPEGEEKTEEAENPR